MHICAGFLPENIRPGDSWKESEKYAQNKRGYKTPFQTFQTQLCTQN